MDKIEKLKKDISSIKIQGATNIAKAGINGLILISSESKAESCGELVKELERYIKEINGLRPTEPFLRNFLNYAMRNIVSSKIDDVKELKEVVRFSALDSLKMIEKNKKSIAKFGAESIKNGSKIMTHCHSSSVMSIFKEAWKSGKRFEVICTESRPLFQGRKSAKELAKAGIAVTLIVDSNAANLVKEVDGVYIGCDLISANGDAVNKVGSYGISKMAKEFNIPLFVCSDLNKFDKNTLEGKNFKVEERSGEEVWKTAFKNLKIFNPAFDIVLREDISKFICQNGIISSGELIQNIKNKNEWLL